MACLLYGVVSFVLVFGPEMSEMIENVLSDVKHAEFLKWFNWFEHI